MRSLMAILVMSSLALAGCGDDKGDDTDDHCADGHVDDDCPSGTDTGTGTSGTRSATSSTTSSSPNEKPVIVLTVKDDAGNVTDFTSAGGNLTFSAEDSEDPDGEITDLAILVTDSNTTRQGSLIQAGQMRSATFQFTRPGVVTVQAFAIDNRAGLSELETQVYVNAPQDLGVFGFKVNSAADVATPEDCTGPTEQAAADALTFHQYYFDVLNGTTWVEASVTGGFAEIAICSPDGTALSGASTTTVESNADAAFSAPADPTSRYYVSAWGVNPPPPAAPPTANDVGIAVVVHYEPRAAA